MFTVSITQVEHIWPLLLKSDSRKSTPYSEFWKSRSPLWGPSLFWLRGYWVAWDPREQSEAPSASTSRRLPILLFLSSAGYPTPENSWGTVEGWTHRNWRPGAQTADGRCSRWTQLRSISGGEGGSMSKSSSIPESLGIAFWSNSKASQQICFHPDWMSFPLLPDFSHFSQFCRLKISSLAPPGPVPGFPTDFSYREEIFTASATREVSTPVFLVSSSRLNLSSSLAVLPPTISFWLELSAFFHPFLFDFSKFYLEGIWRWSISGKPLR